MLTFGQTFTPFPTMPECPRASEARMSAGTWIEIGFEMPASKSGPCAMP